MKKIDEMEFMNTLREIMALSVENQIRLDAMEQVLRETNPLLYELYRGQIETLTQQKAAKMNRALTEKLTGLEPPK